MSELWYLPMPHTHSLTFRFSFQRVGARRVGIRWLPEHQSCVAVCLGDFGGAWALRDTFNKTSAKGGKGKTNSIRAPDRYYYMSKAAINDVQMLLIDLTCAKLSFILFESSTDQI